MRGEIKKSYREWAEIYDDHNDNIAILLEKFVFPKVIAPSKNDHILDLGCGTGRYISSLRKKGARVTGVDFSREMLEVAKSKYPEVKFYYHDITKRLPFKKSTFTKVISSLVFSHIKDKMKPLKEASRVLKKGGKLFITDIPQHHTLKWKKVKFRSGPPKYRLNFEKTSLIVPLGLYVDFADWVGLDTISIIPLRVGKKQEKFLTKYSYKNIKGSLGSVILVFQKR